jgi:predicted TIM-barrel fold metal-dependent hydrolase
MFFDADAHVDECEETWSYFPKANLEFAPRTIEFGPTSLPEFLIAPSGSRHSREWFIDGQIIPRRYRSDKATGTTEQTRELHNISARISDMDNLAIGFQVLYPTVFLSELTLRPDLSVLLCQSYNRWLADRCSASGGRLHWAAILPLISMPEALEEMRWAKEHGACAIFKRAVECHQLSASDPYFFPAYALAAELDLPICIHVGSQWRPVNRHLTPFRIAEGFEGLQAFVALASDGITARFSGLRIGFIEFASDWLPHVLRLLGGQHSLEELNFFVTCEIGEDLNYVISCVGNNNLIMGTDYSHADRASVIRSHQLLVDRVEIDDESTEKITTTNAERLYSIV